MIDSRLIYRPAGLRTRALVLAVLACAALAACESPEERVQSYIERAEALLEEDNLVKAELEAKNAIQIEPMNAEARFLLARIAEERGDFGEMAANLRATVEARPDYLEARLKLGTLYVLGGAPDLAQEQLAAAERLAPDAAGVMVLRARLQAADGDLESAAAELERALDREPDNLEALGLLASVTATQDVDTAVAMVDRALAQNPDEARTLRLLKIQLLQRGGDVDAVDQEYRLLIEDYPDEAGYAYQYARFLAAMERDAEVESVLESLIARQPENTQARLALVQFVAERQGAKAGEALLQRFLEERPDAHELRLVLARQYQATGRTDEAVAEYQRVVGEAGNEDVALTAKSRLAAIELGRGNEEAGETLIEEVLAVDTVNTEALLLRGALRFDRNELKKSVSDLRTVLREEPDNENAQMLLARAHTRAEDLMLAEDAYRRALDMNPSNVQATLELARLLVAEGELDKAEAVLVRQSEQSPANVRVSRALIAIMVERRRFDDALREAERVAKLPGQQAAGDYLLGGIYQLRGQHENAVAAFRRSLEEQPTAREPMQGLVSSLIKLERTDEAIDYLEQVGREYPDNLYSRTLLGQVLAGTGATVEAREVFESTLSENEEWLPAYTALAGLDSADLGAQIDIYRRGLEAVPDSQELTLLLGTAYEKSGQYDEAMRTYERALESNPDMKAVANNLAALIADHRSDEASFERALELVSDFEDSDNPAFLDTLGWLYYRLGRHDEAQPLLERAVEAATDVPVLRYHLGMNYFAQGNEERAREELRAATEGGAEFTGREEAQRVLAELEEQG